MQVLGPGSPEHPQGRDETLEHTPWWMGIHVHQQGSLHFPLRHQPFMGHSPFMG